MNEFYPFKGYEQEYEWSPTLEAMRGLKSGIVLKWKYDHSGRPYVVLWKNGKARSYFKAMCIYSHTNQCEIPRGYQVHHINGCWTDNKIENLQLLTAEEHRKLHAQFQQNDPKRSKAVVAVDEKGNVVHRFASVMEAERYGFGSGAVSCACRGRFNREGNHKYKGLYWWYEDEWLAMEK